MTKQKTEQDVMHIGLNEPNESRKEFLKLAIEVIQNLKEYEEIKKRREIKIELYKEGLKIFDELYPLIEDFEEMLPKVKMPKKAFVKKSKEMRERKEFLQKPEEDIHSLHLEKQIQLLKEKIASL